MSTTQPHQPCLQHHRKQALREGSATQSLMLTPNAMPIHTATLVFLHLCCQYAVESLIDTPVYKVQRVLYKKVALSVVDAGIQKEGFRLILDSIAMQAAFTRGHAKIPIRRRVLYSECWTLFCINRLLGTSSSPLAF